MAPPSRSRRTRCCAWGSPWRTASCSRRTRRRCGRCCSPRTTRHSARRASSRWCRTSTSSSTSLAATRRGSPSTTPPAPTAFRPSAAPSPRATRPPPPPSCRRRRGCRLRRRWRGWTPMAAGTWLWAAWAEGRAAGPSSGPWRRPPRRGPRRPLGAPPRPARAPACSVRRYSSWSTWASTSRAPWRCSRSRTATWSSPSRCCRSRGLVQEPCGAGSRACAGMCGREAGVVGPPRRPHAGCFGGPSVGRWSAVCHGGLLSPPGRGRARWHG
mmetsp:Transcript_55549/g.146518  ORF Transcript_55549/g.146518 Transcript_55549/m.146518 type:complete len:270 (-) Transcript_55549:188-997(-)